MSKTAAKEVLRKLEGEYDRKKFGIVDEKLIPFEEFSKEYLEYSKTNKAEESHRRDKTSMQNLNRFFRSIHLPRLTTHLIEQFKIKRLSEGVAPRTVNIELTCLSHMLNKAVERGYIKESPFKGIKLLTYEKKPPKFLTGEEVSKLLGAASPWLKPIIIVMLNTGIRDGERRRLKFEDIDFKNKRILIRSSKAKDYRAIPMNEEVEKILKWLQENYIPSNSISTKSCLRKEHQKEYVFCNEDGSPVQHIKRAFRNACRKAGLRGASPHTLRHTFASHLVMSGVDLRTVQRLLGHKSISTTIIYSHLTEDHLKN
ncbi:MAG TPA: tyrosine-type recombinase/integrase [Thermodesulfobacteriota bacterium]|nr:tyrosine-type recombinase/integrase [Thermodesulfobacteriota bacterium]